MSSFLLNKEYSKELLLRCDCHDVFHQASFEYFIDEIEDGIYLNILPHCYLPLHKRIRVALGYIFGKTTRYDSLYLNKEDIVSIVDFLKKAKNNPQ